MNQICLSLSCKNSQDLLDKSKRYARMLLTLHQENQFKKRKKKLIEIVPNKVKFVFEFYATRADTAEISLGMPE